MRFLDKMYLRWHKLMYEKVSGTVVTKDVSSKTYLDKDGLFHEAPIFHYKMDLDGYLMVYPVEFYIFGKPGMPKKGERAVATIARFSIGNERRAYSVKKRAAGAVNLERDILGYVGKN